MALPWIFRQWWFWPLALLGVVLVVALAIGIAGRAAWRHELAAERAAGIPCSLSEVVAAAPGVDAAQQERLRRWCDSVSRATWVHMFMQPQEPLAAAWRGEPLQVHGPHDDSEDPLQHSAELVELSTILDAGPVIWGKAGSLREQFPQPELVHASEFETIWHTGDSRRALVPVAEVYGAQALALHDPAARRHLDQLAAAAQPNLSPWELRTSLDLATYRDLTYLLLVADGSLSATQAASWLGEAPPSTAALMQSLTSGRLTNAYLAEGDYGIMRRSGRTQQWTDPFVVLLLDTLAPQQVAWAAERARLIGGAFEGRALPARFWQPDSLRLTELMIPSEARLWLTMLNRHRMVRAAARALLAWRAGALPADQAAAEAMMGPLLHGSGRILPPLVYERLSASRFRVGIADPHGAGYGTLDPYIPYREATNPVRCGGPAGTDGLIVRGWLLEIDAAMRVAYGSVAVPAVGK